MSRELDEQCAEIDLDASAARLEKARAELSALCHGKRFLMSIPVREDDSDRIIGNALSDMRKLIQEVERLRARIDAIDVEDV
jgi:hypothetical protein